MLYIQGFKNKREPAREKVCKPTHEKKSVSRHTWKVWQTFLSPASPAQPYSIGGIHSAMRQLHPPLNCIHGVWCVMWVNSRWPAKYKEKRCQRLARPSDSLYLVLSSPSNRKTKGRLSYQLINHRLNQLENYKRQFAYLFITARLLHFLLQIYRFYQLSIWNLY